MVLEGALKGGRPLSRAGPEMMALRRGRVLTRGVTGFRIGRPQTRVHDVGTSRLDALRSNAVRVRDTSAGASPSPPKTADIVSQSTRTPARTPRPQSFAASFRRSPVRFPEGTRLLSCALAGCALCVHPAHLLLDCQASSQDPSVEEGPPDSSRHSPGQGWPIGASPACPQHPGLFLS